MKHKELIQYRREIISYLFKDYKEVTIQGNTVYIDGDSRTYIISLENGKYQPKPCLRIEPSHFTTKIIPDATLKRILNVDVIELDKITSKIIAVMNFIVKRYISRRRSPLGCPIITICEYYDWKCSGTLREFQDTSCRQKHRY